MISTFVISMMALIGSIELDLWPVYYADDIPEGDYDGIRAMDITVDCINPAQPVICGYLRIDGNDLDRVFALMKLKRSTYGTTKCIWSNIIESFPLNDAYYDDDGYAIASYSNGNAVRFIGAGFYHTPWLPPDPLVQTNTNTIARCVSSEGAPLFLYLRGDSQQIPYGTEATNWDILAMDDLGDVFPSLEGMEGFVSCGWAMQWLGGDQEQCQIGFVEICSINESTIPVSVTQEYLHHNSYNETMKLQWNAILEDSNSLNPALFLSGRNTTGVNSSEFDGLRVGVCYEGLNGIEIETETVPDDAEFRDGPIVLLEAGRYAVFDKMNGQPNSFHISLWHWDGSSLNCTDSGVCNLPVTYDNLFVGAAQYYPSSNIIVAIARAGVANSPVEGILTFGINVDEDDWSIGEIEEIAWQPIAVITSNNFCCFHFTSETVVEGIGAYEIQGPNNNHGIGIFQITDDQINGYTPETVIEPGIPDVGRVVVAPNPSFGSTAITIENMSGAEASRVTIVDIHGRTVRDMEGITCNRAIWNRCDENGESVPSGIYFALLENDLSTIVASARIVVF